MYQSDKATAAANGSPIETGPVPRSNKRRHSSDSDDAAMEEDNESEEDSRKKRSKTGVTNDDGNGAPSPNSTSRNAITIDTGIPTHRRETSSGSAGNKTKNNPTSPPAPLSRRTSGTPALGVEMSIASRPATPSSSSSTTPKNGSNVGAAKSPLISQDSKMSLRSSCTVSASLPTPARQPVQPGPTLPISSKITPQKPGGSGTQTSNDTTAPSSSTPPRTLAGSAEGLDETEWAAFEADIAAISSESKKTYDEDAVISAPALTAEQIALRKDEEERHRREEEQATVMESVIEGEKEDASRALEEEFEEMEELENRVRRLKNKMERLRRESAVRFDAIALAEARKPVGVGKINERFIPEDEIKTEMKREQERGASEDDDEEEGEETDEDDGENEVWRGGFRLRA